MAPSATDPSLAVATKSGITTTKEGDSFIPSSVRPDGSVRREIRVKPGYKPPEDVEVYKNRTAEAWKSRGKGGVPGADPAEDNTDLPNAAAANKNAKRREARKKAAEKAKDGDEEGKESKRSKVIKDWNSFASGNGGAGEKAEEKAEVNQKVAIDAEAEKGKEARKISKKLRQARELKDKKELGDNLLPEQFEKVIKINELIRQLDSLGFDQDGEKKEPAAD